MLDDVRTKHGDRQRRDRGRDARGMTTSRRSFSPDAASSKPTYQGSRDNRPGQHQDSVEKTQPGPRRSHKSGDRSQNSSNRPSHIHPRRGREDPRDSDRGREPVPPARRRSSGPRREPNAHPGSTGTQGGSRVSSFAKRPRSPSLSLGGSEPKKSRRARSPRRPAKPPLPAEPSLPGQDHRRPPPTPRRDRSPERRDRRAKSKRNPGRQRSPSPRRGRSPSPHPEAHFSENPNDIPLNDKTHPRRRTSPRLANQRHRSTSRQRSPFPRGSRPTTSSDTGSHARPTPDFDPPRPPRPRPHPPPRSPGDHGPSRPHKRGINREETGVSQKFDPSSGANSVEVNMSARGGYRGGYTSHMQSGFSAKGQYDQGSHDVRIFSQSSAHATPSSSYHGSPPSQSPYGGSGRGWGGPQQYSPQQ
jgi:CTD kinase subunit alpha